MFWPGDQWQQVADCSLRMIHHSLDDLLLFRVFGAECLICFRLFLEFSFLSISMAAAALINNSFRCCSVRRAGPIEWPGATGWRTKSGRPLRLPRPPVECVPVGPAQSVRARKFATRAGRIHSSIASVANKWRAAAPEARPASKLHLGPLAGADSRRSGAGQWL